MDHPPFIVYTAVPDDIRACESLLRGMRRLTHRNQSPVLLLCDLPDARTLKAAGDEALLRTLQSGVMSMERRAPGRYMLLVRSRVFDDAQRMYLGASHPVSPGQTAAQLLMTGKSDARFDAATVSPASLKGRAGDVLLLSCGAACMPDTPARLQEALHACGAPCLAGRALLPRRGGEPLLCRLLRTGFSLSPLRAARALHLLRLDLADPANTLALMLSRKALEGLSVGALPSRCPVARDCCVLLPPPSAPDMPITRLREAFSAALSPSCRDPLARFDALLPLLRLVLLFIAAHQGQPMLAAIAALLPEAAAILHPQLLPGALVRLSLLPVCALLSMDALLRRLLARSALFRVELPEFMAGGGLCAASGALLFAAALRGNHALAAMTSVALLFAAAPLLLRALASPVRERIPLSDIEQSRLLSMAKSAFLQAADEPAPAPHMMLCDCAGCMLGLLEPDEAARRTLKRLEALPGHPLTPADAACALAAAQYLREHMGDCDASLRPLPAQIESRICSLPVLADNTALGRLMQRACVSSALTAERADPLEALFLPFSSQTDKAAELLPLSAPHTFLCAHPDGSLPQLGSAADRALILAEAALGRPFLSLLHRSPAAGPYAPLLDLS
ncbi:MAG: hypothetical protein J6M47_01935 [Clostridia bacterium]|nr:hypothetical protein [Clostridia bacterium]